MNKLLPHHVPTLWFVGIGVMAVIAGGIVSAFLAHLPSQLAMWASAYLVLVVGVTQVAFGLSLRKLSRPSATASLWVALGLYNMANLGVLLGTMYKTTAYGPTATTVGGIGLVLALLCMIYSIRGARPYWLLRLFYIVTVIMLASVPIGLWLARH